MFGTETEVTSMIRMLHPRYTGCEHSHVMVFDLMVDG